MFQFRFLSAQREENALKVGAKIRIFIGFTKNLNKKTLEL